jgi:hypothetical protein
MDAKSAVQELILAVRGLAAECDHSSDKSAYLPHLAKAEEYLQEVAKAAPVVDGSKDHIALVPPADEEV